MGWTIIPPLLFSAGHVDDLALVDRRDELLSALKLVYNGKFEKAADLVEHFSWYHKYFDNKDMVNMLRGTMRYRVPDRKAFTAVAGSKSIRPTANDHPGQAEQGSSD